MAIALFTRLSLLFAPSIPSPDTALYLAIAEKITFAPTVEVVQFNTIRTPGYPLFIGPLRLIPGSWGDAIAIVQHLLGVVLAGGVSWAGCRYFGRIVGVLAGLAVALSPLMIELESTLTPDLLLAVAIFSGTILLIEAVRPETPDYRFLAAAGVVFGVAAYLKPGALPLALAGVLPLAMVSRDWRLTLRGSLVLAVSLALVVLPWFARNWAVYDRFTMSTIGEIALFDRVFAGDRFPMPTDTHEGMLVKREQDRLSSKPPNPGSVWRLHTALSELGYSNEQIAAMVGRLAREAIMRHPIAYGRSTLDNVWDNIRLTKSGTGVLMSERLGRSDVTLPLDGEMRSWSLGSRYAQALWLLSIGGLLVLILLFVGDRRQRGAAASLLSAWALVAVSSAAAWHPEARYAGEVAPLLWLLQLGVIVFLAAAGIRWIRRAVYRHRPAVS